MKREVKLKKMKLKDKIIIYFPIILFALFCLIPFVVLLSSSFTGSSFLKENGAQIIPHDLSLGAYKTIFLYPQMIIKAYGVSLLVTVLGTLLNLIISLPVAYTLSRMEFKFRNVVSFILYISMVFNAGLIPTYIWFRNYLKIFDTFWVLILPNTCIVGYVFLLRVFYSGLPSAIIESARIDGASEYRTFLTIALPLIKPGIATVAFYTVLYYWNDPNAALYYTDNANLTPIALYMSRISNYIEALKWLASTGVSVDFEIPEDSLIFATAIITSGPMLFVFVFFQKYFVAGMTTGGVKE